MLFLQATLDGLVLMTWAAALLCLGVDRHRSRLVCLCWALAGLLVAIILYLHRYI